MSISPEGGVVRSGLALALSSLALLGAHKNNPGSNYNPNQYQPKHELTTDQLKSLGYLSGTIELVAYDIVEATKPHKKHHAKKPKHELGIPQSELPHILLRIGGCESDSGPESQIEYHAQNPTSSASGGFQIEDGTWDGQFGVVHAKDTTPDEQNLAAKKLYDQRGTEPWYPSEGCWG
jgi:hypothetical protein